MQQEDLANAVDRPHAVSYVSGQVAADGQSVVLRVETAEDKPIELAVAMPDLQYLTTLLLLLGDKAVKLAKASPAPRQLQMIPVPCAACRWRRARTARRCWCWKSAARRSRSRCRRRS
jgi:hypothetical protein